LNKLWNKLITCKNNNAIPVPRGVADAGFENGRYIACLLIVDAFFARFIRTLYCAESAEILIAWRVL
jgi:hypothetical protein